MSRAQLTSTVEQNSAGAAAPVVAGKNAVANGGFDIWQRGISFSSAGYTSDRWSGSNSTGTLSITRSTDVPSSPKFNYSLSLANTSGTYPQIAQRIEAANSTLLAGQTVTLSFYAKSTAGSNSIYWISSYAGSADNWSSPTNDQSGAVAITSSWARYSLTFAASASATNGYQILIGRQDASSTTSTTLVTGIQLELGSVATPFSRAGGTLQGELALCQRYYYAESNGYTLATVGGGICRQASTTQTYGTFRIPTIMRTGPSLTIVNSTGASLFSGVSNVSVTNITSNGATNTSYALSITHGSIGAAGYAIDLSLGTVIFQLSAEL